MMKSILLAGVALIGFAAAAHAADITFNFANTAATSTTGGTTYTNSMTYVSSGLTLTIRGYGQTADVSGTDPFERASIRRYNGNGLGVCNQDESCSSPNHQVDNVGDNDLVQFVFSQKVSVKSVSIRSYSSNDNYDDLDVSYWIGTDGNPDIAGLIPSGFGTEGFGAETQDSVAGDAGNTTRTVTINSANNLLSLLFGAYFGDSDQDDAFKIRSITVSVTEVAEPGALAVFGIGLAALGYSRRRRG